MTTDDRDTAAAAAQDGPVPGAPVGSGRAMPPSSPFAGDDGTAPAALAAALATEDGDARLVAVVEAVRSVRLLVPVLAGLDERAEPASPGAPAGEKVAHAATVTVEGPDGRAVLPVFSSTATLRVWRPDARPVPVQGRRAALAAGADADGLLVLDPGGPVTVALPRPAVRAIALDEPWVPAWRDEQVALEVRTCVQHLPHVVTARVVRGDRTEVEVVVWHDLGQTDDGIGEVLRAVRDRLTRSALVVDRVDSMTVRPRVTH